MAPPPTDPARTEPSLWEPLRYEAFRRMWLGFVVSHVGDFIQLIAQNWLVVELTRSALKVAVVAFAQAVPRLVISLFAGVVVDRVDRRKLLLVTQSLAAAQSLVFLALVLTGRITYGAIVALALALGVLDSLNLTARTAVMPSLVPRELIARSVALQSLGVNVTQILGPLCSALLLGTLGAKGCLAVNALSFLLLLATLVGLELPKTAGGGARSFTDDLREGLAYVRGERLVFYPIAFAWALGLLGMPLARLLPLFARVALGTDARGYGLLAVASGVGALGASLFITARAEPAQLPRNIVAAGVAFGCAIAAFGWTRGYALAWATLLVFGAAQMAFRSAVTTLLQVEVPDRMRGRVMSVLAIDFSLWSIGATLAGGLADAIARHHGGSGDGAVAYGLTRALTVHGALCVAVVALGARGFLKAPRA